MQFHIGFDESHHERGKLGSNYRTLRQLLEGEGFGCWEYSSFPITRQSLQNYDILVFACTDASKYTAEEIEAVATWVKEDGGGLLMLSHAGGDRGRRTNMTEMATQFGMLFENDQVLDDMNNFGIDNMPNIKTFPNPHPIIEGLSSICYRAGCSVSIVGMSQSLALTNPSSNPGNVTVIASSEPGEGKVVCIGSYEILRDEINGGLAQPGHAQLAKNIFSWLITPRRVMLREGGTVLASSPGAASTPPASSGAFDPYGVTKPQEGPLKDHGGKILQITSIHDLFLEMQNIVKDIDLLRARVMNVYGVVSSLDSGEGGGAAAPSAAAHGLAPVSKKTEPVATKKGEEQPEGPPQSKDDFMAMFAGVKGKKQEGSPSAPAASAPAAPSGPSMSNLLSELKTEARKKDIKPEDLKALQVDQPGLGKVAEEKAAPPTASVVKEYLFTSTDKRKSKAELEDEIDKLESKIKSSENLKTFVDKQFKDGKKSREDYDREANRLVNDITTTKSKIEAYKKLADSK